jgi:hypothetical protein
MQAHKTPNSEPQIVHPTFYTIRRGICITQNQMGLDGSSPQTGLPLPA